MTDTGFEVWMTLVDRALVAKSGLSSTCLPDWGYRDAYDGGMKAADAAEEVLEAACEDMGMDFEEIFG